MKRIMLFLLSLFFVSTASAGTGGTVVDFEDLTLNPGSYWNGSDLSGGFTSRGVQFNNSYNAPWQSWQGFSYSNMTDTGTEGFAGQYNAITGGGVDSSNYGVGYVGFSLIPRVTLPTEQVCAGFFVTNDNYTFYSMKNGDAFSKKFETGDWFKLTITGKDGSDKTTGTVETYLAVGTDIYNTWRWVPLGALGSVKSLEFTLSSTDNGAWGMNTPAFFCMDNLTLAGPLSVPTLSQWGIIIFLISMGLTAIIVIRRRREVC